MKVAISTENGSVSAHFGRCPSYTLVDIDGNKINNRDEIPNPGHRPGFLPEYLAEKGVSCIIAGGMGPRAQELFAQKGIQTIIGIQGSIEEILKKYLNNELQPGQDLCSHQHGEGNQGGEDSPSHAKLLPVDGKICFTSKNQVIEADIDPRFGRAPYYLLLDPVSLQMEAIKNPYSEEAHGAGIRAAQLMVEKGVKIILTGPVGPKADQVLQAAGIQVVSITTGTVEDAIKRMIPGSN